MPRGKPKPLRCDATFLNEGGYRPDILVQDEVLFRRPDSDAWVDKYAPLTIDEVCGNEAAKGELFECVSSDVSVPIVVYGGIGVGKRTAVNLCLQACDFDVKEYSLSICSLQEVGRECNPDENVILAMCSSVKRKAVVCLDVASLSRADRNELFAMMRQVAKTTLCIIIDTAPHDQCVCIHFEDLTHEDIGVNLAWIAAEEKLFFKESDVPLSSDMRSCVQALQFGEMGSVYIQSGDSDFCTAARAAQSMQANCDDPLEAVVLLSDAMSDVDCAPYDRAVATSYAAGIATLFDFEQAATLSNVARHAQITRQKVRISSAWRSWGLSPVADALAKQVLTNYLLHDDKLDPMTDESAHTLGIICRSTDSALNRLVTRKIKLLQTARTL